MSTDPSSQQPLVTIITASFNLVTSGRADYFRQCVESVHNQTYGNIEHLIMDGASTDGTRELIAEYEEKGWVTCHSEADKGVYDAMNKGLNKARGKYIAFLNTDDYWHDSRGVALSVEMLEQTESDYSYAPHEILGEDDALIGEFTPRMETFYCVLPFCHQTMFCRTELLRERGGFDNKTYRVCADYDFMIELIASGRRGVYVPLCFTRFRHGGLSCTALDTDRQERLAIFRHHYGHIIGDDAAEKLNEKVVPLALIEALSDTVGDMVRVQMKREPLLPCHLTTTWQGPLGIPLLSRQYDGRQRRIYKLFGFLPLLASTDTERADGSSLCWLSLFSLLPFWKTITRPSATSKHYLLGFIPIGKTKNRNTSYFLP